MASLSQCGWSNLVTPISCCIVPSIWQSHGKEYAKNGKICHITLHCIFTQKFWTPDPHPPTLCPKKIQNKFWPLPLIMTKQLSSMAANISVTFDFTLFWHFLPSVHSKFNFKCHPFALISKFTAFCSPRQISHPNITQKSPRYHTNITQISHLDK